MAGGAHQILRHRLIVQHKTWQVKLGCGFNCLSAFYSIEKMCTVQRHRENQNIFYQTKNANEKINIVLELVE